MLPRVVRVLREAVGPVVVVAAPGQDVPPLPAGVVIVRDDVEGRATTSFRHLLALVAPILGQDAALTRAIQAANPEAPRVLEHLAEEVAAVRALLFEGESSRLEARLAKVRATLR